MPSTPDTCQALGCGKPLDAHHECQGGFRAHADRVQDARILEAQRIAGALYELAKQTKECGTGSRWSSMPQGMGQRRVHAVPSAPGHST